MKSLVRFAILGAVVAASSTMAFATPYSGSAGIGPADCTTATFGATSIDFTPVPLGTGTCTGTNTPQGIVNEVSGSFTNFVTNGDLVNLSNLTFGSSTTQQLLSYNSATFDVLSSMVAFFDGDSLTVNGNGYFSYMGTEYPGTFILTASNTGSVSFEITAGTPSPTPEPNSLLLMGTGLMAAAGLLFMRRRRISSAL